MLRRTAFAAYLNRSATLAWGIAFGVMLAIIWGSCLWPAQFEATGTLVAQADPHLQQIQNAPLQKALNHVLTQPMPPLTARANSAKEAVHTVNLALQKKQRDAMAYLQPALKTALQQQKTALAQTQQQIQRIDQQLTQFAAQNPRSLTTHDLNRKRKTLQAMLANTRQKLKKLQHRQAVWTGSNRTLSDLLAKRKLLTQKLHLQTTTQRQSTDHPAVRQTQAQIQKFQVRIDALKDATHLDEHADEQLRTVRAAVAATQKTITQNQHDLTTLATAEKALAQQAPLRSKRQAILAQLPPQQTQLKRLTHALRGQWQVIQIHPATESQAKLISPTSPQIALAAMLGGVCVWLGLTLATRMFDRTLHHEDEVAERLDLPVLGYVAANPKRQWTKPALKLAMAAVLIFSFAMVHWLSPAKQNGWFHFHQPTQTQQVALN